MEQTKTKKALIMSVLSVFLCIAMLIGMTFAWFTDTASTGVNTIQAGNLKVAIVNEAGNSIENDTLNFVNKDDSSNILWEPGVTFRTTGFRIKNLGNLALKYKLSLNGITGDNELLDVITFSVVKKNDNGDYEEVDLNKFEDKLTAQNAMSDVLYIQGHMDENAGNEYQKKSIEGIGITVNATQLNHESDSIGPDYDEDAPLDFTAVGTAAELKAVFANAKAGENVNVSLTDNVTIGENAFSALNGGTEIGDITIQGNGHTITNANSNSVRGLQIANSTQARTVTISNTKLKLTGTGTGYNAKENRGVQLYGLENTTVNLINCTIDMTATDYSYAVKVINSKNLTINITGCTLTSANCIETNGATNCTFNITDCKLNSNYAPHATYCGNGIQDKNGTNNTYNIKNTTFNGTNAQAWQTSATTTINDLGGNVDNTKRTKN